MGEEVKEKGFFDSIKSKVMTSIGVILTGIGTMFMSEVKTFIGIGDEPAPVEQIQQDINVAGPTIVVNIPEQKRDTVVKKVYIKPVVKPKEKEELIDW